jgi:hypothetical protein
MTIKRAKTIAAIVRTLEHHGIVHRTYVDDKGQTYFIVSKAENLFLVHEHFFTIRQAEIYCAGLADKERLMAQVHESLGEAQEQLEYTRDLLRRTQEHCLTLVRDRIRANGALPPLSGQADDYEAIAYDPYVGMPEPDVGYE